MQNWPAISIITPSFNQGSYIEETLKSVNRQEYPRLEHIVVDGGSTDGTLEIVKRYSSLPSYGYLRWIAEPDNGQTDALNKGFRMASGDIIGWLNSDDVYEPTALRYAAEFFDRNPEIDFVYGDYKIVDAAGSTLLEKKEIDFDWDILLCGLNYIAQPNVLFRRRVFDALGYLNDSLHYLMDYEFWLRAASRGFRFGRVPLTLAGCRWHLDSKTVSCAPAIDRELMRLRQQYWNKRSFRNPTLQLAYQKGCNVRARALRQWRKLRTRHAIDVIPASWHLQAWKLRQAIRLRPA
ncbi:MAG TPA: glycosyltransferase family 2 protein [Terriglobales bacterium]